MHLQKNEQIPYLLATDRINNCHRATFIMRGHSSRCESLIARKEHVLVGVSPFNSKFSADYVEALLSWAHSAFSSVDVLLPDEEHAAMLLHATDVPAGKAIRKTRKELNRHRRTLEQCLERIGVPARDTRIFHFSDCAAHPNYLHLRNSVFEAYESCEKFRSACIDMSLQAIRGRSAGIGRSDAFASALPEKIGMAIPYIFAEMPFYLGTPDLIEVNSSILAYHRAWPIGDALWAGDFPISVNKNQGHGIVSMIGDSTKIHRHQ